MPTTKIEQVCLRRYSMAVLYNMSLSSSQDIVRGDDTSSHAAIAESGRRIQTRQPLALHSSYDCRRQMYGLLLQFHVARPEICFSICLGLLHAHGDIRGVPCLILAIYPHLYFFGHLHCKHGVRQCSPLSGNDETPCIHPVYENNQGRFKISLPGIPSSSMRYYHS